MQAEARPLIVLAQGEAAELGNVLVGVLEALDLSPELLRPSSSRPRVRNLEERVHGRARVAGVDAARHASGADHEAVPGRPGLKAPVVEQPDVERAGLLGVAGADLEDADLSPSAPGRT